MKQAFIKKGQVIVDESPAPNISEGTVLIKVVYSCISAGTETSNVQSSGKSLIRRALDQPEQVGKIINMVRSDGIEAVYHKVRGKVDSIEPTGYSVSGIVIGAGKNVTGFSAGDHVAAAGVGYANHAEYVEVPVNLVIKIPKSMDLAQASTVALGSIALQGVRRAELKLGEYCVIIGSGILGLITLQMLRASGIRCAITDLDERRIQVARDLGAELAIHPGKDDSLKIIDTWTNGMGADAVIFTAASTDHEPLSQSFKMCRKKGRVVLVGVSGMMIKREDIFPKELDFLISTSYGPGRYDSNYEEKGIDYPYGYVRWTEKRNMEEYLRLVHTEKILLAPMIDSIFTIDQVTEAFQSLQEADKRPLIVLLNYGEMEKALTDFSKTSSHKINFQTKPLDKKKINLALVGTGAFVTTMHLPNLFKLKDRYNIHAVMDRIGHKSKMIAQQYGAAYATTNFDDILSDPDTDLVFIATRHDSHASMTLKALEAGKHVFVEKPLAITTEELDSISNYYTLPNPQCKPMLMVGYNRRFSPYAREIHMHMKNRLNPAFIHYRMNAGYLPPDHWVHEHGGRIIGEACHIIDLTTFLLGSTVISVSSESLSPSQSKFRGQDNKTITLKYEDGSIAVIDYFSVGSKLFPKEYMEVHFDEKTIIMDDYKSLKGYGISVEEMKTANSEKGHLEELEALFRSLQKPNPEWPIDLTDYEQTSRITFLVQ